MRLLFFFLFCGALGAQAPTPLADGSVPLARGNAPGEQHHHLVLENSYVRTYNVIVPARESTLLHRHDEDYVYVAMGPADVLNAVLDKPEIHVQLKDGDVRFARGGFSHVARNLSDAPFHNVTIALLHPQGAVRNLCEKIVEGPLGDCDTELDVKDRPGVGVIGYKARGWFETEEVRADLATLDGDSSHSDAASQLDRLLVVLAEGELEVMSPGKPAAKLHGSDVLWLSAGLAFTFTNRAALPSRFLLTSFKNPAPPPDVLYNTALSDFNAGKNELAMQEFVQYVQLCGNSARASNAQFYLGEIDYRRRNFSAAIADYNKVLDQFPGGNKEAAARLKKGFALLELGQRDAGVQELRSLIARYPKSPEALQARDRLTKLGPGSL